MLATPTFYRMIQLFTDVRVLLIAVLISAVAVGWQVNVADATEDNAATITACIDQQGRLRVVEDADDCKPNEEPFDVGLVTQQGLDEATQVLQEQIDELENTLAEQGQQVDVLEQTVEDQAEDIQALEARIAALEDDQNGAPGDGDLGDRVTDLEQLLDGVSRAEVDGHDTLRFAGMNLQLVNDEGSTATTNSLGNLIVGYNEEPAFGEVQRDGSHNLVIGAEHNYSASGGLVAGHRNTISADFASVTGGQSNTASAEYGSVSGGMNNTASALHASVLGGERNHASGIRSAVSGGNSNTASHSTASVSGGFGNTAANLAASVSGGAVNQAQGPHSSVLGGHEIIVDTQFGMHPEP